MVRFAALNGTLQNHYYPRRVVLSAAKRTSKPVRWEPRRRSEIREL